MKNKKVIREGCDEWIVYTFGDRRFEAVWYNKTCIKDECVAYIYLDSVRIAEFTIYAPRNYFTREAVRGAIHGMIDQLVDNLQNSANTKTKKGESK